MGLSVAGVYLWCLKKHARGTALTTVGCTDGGRKVSRSKQFNFLAEVVETSAPAVVFITRREAVQTLFGRGVSESSGSGFIVDDSGYVLTNAHVVGNTREVVVKLQDGREFTGVVTDTDPITDLALIKLMAKKGEKFPKLDFGSSAETRPGEWVVALGNPLTLSNTITSGIVSSVHRPSSDLGLENIKPKMEYVQTDAPITIGNSGGPLVNLDGEVIGVNTMTAAPGISFAIPSDLARQFCNRANKTAKTPRPPAVRYSIGVSMITVTPQVLEALRREMGLERDIKHGVFLARVLPYSPADKAGLMGGDIILSINKKPATHNNFVQDLVQTGRTLEMEIIRRRTRMTVKVQPEPLR